MQIERSTVLRAAIAIAVVVAGYLVYRIVSPGDEATIEDLADEITAGPIDRDRVERLLAWVDPDLEPLEVDALGMQRVYGAGESATLHAEAHRVLARYTGEDARALRQSIDVEGDAATLELQLLTSQGMTDVRLRLRRHDGRWLVNRIRVGR